MTTWHIRFISLVSLAVALGAVAYTNMYVEGTPVAYTPAITSSNLDALGTKISQTDIGAKTTQITPSTSKGTTSTPSTAGTNQTSANQLGASSQTSATKYKDGTYTADGAYFVPEGSEKITVTVTIANDTIASANVTGQGSRGDSRKYISRFISGYSQYVVGANIDSVRLTRVSGSSLTPNGFNAALELIKKQAAA